MTNSRRKGKEGELELARWLRERGIAARRGQQFRGGADSPDIVAELEGFHIEVKRTERLSIYEALGKATVDAAYGSVPVVFHRQSRRNWVVILDADAFIRLVASEPPAEV